MVCNAQITVNGANYPIGGGRPGACPLGTMKLKGVASASGSCIDLTQNAFQSGGLWVCDAIDLNQNFRIDFEINFDATNSGDGIAFVMQEEGVSDVLGGAGGGLGYSHGNRAGCLGGDCLINPSIAVEFDIWDNSADLWDFSNPGLGTINDRACDHVAMLVDSDQRTSGTILAPTCLAGVDVTDGANHAVCLLWDPLVSEFSITFDGTTIATRAGDIRTFFADPSTIYWGFTAGSGGANQNLRICNVVMNTNLPSPPTPCTILLSNKLLDFSANCKDEETVLNWVLSNEHQIQEIRVESSQNGIDFNQISQIETTPQRLTYSLLALQTEQSNSYYRLKLIGQDGQTDYSDWINSNCHETTSQNIRLYPNPVKDALNIQTLDSEVLSVQLYDANGRLCLHQHQQDQKALTKIDLSSFSQGLYFILVQTKKGGSKSFKINKI